MYVWEVLALEGGSMEPRPWKLYPFEGRIGRQSGPSIRTRAFVTKASAIEAGREQAREYDWPMVVWAKDQGFIDVHADDEVA